MSFQAAVPAEAPAGNAVLEIRGLDLGGDYRSVAARYVVPECHLTPSVFP